MNSSGYLEYGELIDSFINTSSRPQYYEKSSYNVLLIYTFQ